ncbi:putative secreted protein [Rhodopirellula maiorica SM1]|uniref:Putative secreted protein n=1 Tax=Rhodopirellula maiorica SM1 TaxID=1265738 RepID=M5S5H9_9BACT|nr:DUF4142 domain-containing protein [Rhodopirellula maiorica]EMI22902.1 putative secreted protein [Rhodopirellula maiorica SM1]
MSTLRFSAAVLAIAAIPGLSSAYGQTTLDQPGVQIDERAAQQGQTTDQPGQPTTLPSQITDQPAGTQNDQGDRYEARRVATNSQQQAPTVKQALVQKLIKANEAEIEIAKLAQQKSDNQQVKRLAQTMIQDHQALNQTLQQHAGQQQQGGQQHTGSTAAGQAHTDRNTIAGNQPATRSDLQGDRTTQFAGKTVPRELCQISEQACDNALKMTKEMLGNYEGQDFNMAFLGQQTVAHTMLLAELRAIESMGPQELQPIVQQASNKVSMHLEKTKQLAKQLEDDRRTSNQSNPRNDANSRQ